ncbi:14184_t:CDS:1, partial [Racocetra persica]
MAIENNRSNISNNNNFIYSSKIISCINQLQQCFISNNNIDVENIKIDVIDTTENIKMDIKMDIDSKKRKMDIDTTEKLEMNIDSKRMKIDFDSKKIKMNIYS